jgi:hypothetical protein
MSKKRIKRKKRLTSFGTKVILSMNYYKKLVEDEADVKAVVIGYNKLILSFIYVFF